MKRLFSQESEIGAGGRTYPGQVLREKNITCRQEKKDAAE
jgi:hypothetical protein